MAHRVRKAMANNVNELPLSGSIEIDAAIIKADCGQATQRPSFAAKDVLGITSRGGVLRLFVLEQLKKVDIEHIVRKNLGEVEAIYTDMCYKLRFLRDLAPHFTVNHWLSYVNGEAHVNNCENAFSLFKRGLMGLFHHVSAKWLQNYLDAFAFRCSHRYEKGALFDLVLASCWPRPSTSQPPEWRMTPILTLTHPLLNLARLSRTGANRSSKAPVANTSCAHGPTPQGVAMKCTLP